MSDLIRREDAIKAIKGNSYLDDDYIEINGYGAIEDIRTLPSADTDLSGYSDKLWKNAYERGKEEEHRWWSEHCAKCTDADRPQGDNRNEQNE